MTGVLLFPCPSGLVVMVLPPGLVLMITVFTRVAVRVGCDGAPTRVSSDDNGIHQGVCQGWL